MRFSSKAWHACYRSCHRFAVLTCLVLAWPLAATAQTSSNLALAPLTAEARENINKGISAAKESKYQVAVQYFQEARTSSPFAPELFYNLGLVESRIAGRELRAIAWFGAYLASAPNMPNAAAVRKQINVLDATATNNLTRLLKLILEQSSRPTIDKEALPFVAGVLAGAGDFDGALTIVNQIPDRVSDVSNSDMQNSARKAVVIGLAEFGDMKHAQDLANMIVDPAEKISVEAKIAECQVALGDFEGARKSLALVLEASEEVDRRKIPQRQSIISPTLEKQLIANIQFMAGDPDGARKTLASALKVIDPAWPSRYRFIDRIRIAQQQGWYGDIASAKATLLQTLADVSPKSDTRNDDLNSIATELANIDDMVDARKIASRIQDKAPRDKTIKAIETIAEIAPGNRLPKVPARASVAEIKVSDWLKMLDSSQSYGSAPLNDKPFLDLVGYLETEPPQDKDFHATMGPVKTPQDRIFLQLVETAEELSRAQHKINLTLKQMAAQQTNP
jgi:tetratricopeptide (TPR) repeat protein